MSKSYVEIDSIQLRALLERGALRMEEHETRHNERLLAYGRKYLRVRFAAWRGKPLSDKEVMKMVSRDGHAPWGYGGDRALFKKLMVAAKTSSKVLLYVDELAYITRWVYHIEER